MAIGCKCAYNCRSIDDTERERLFREFYKLKSHDVQNKYLFGLICKQPIKRKRRSASLRSHSIVYRVRLGNGSHVQVCKKTFCDLHAITKRRIEILSGKLSAGVLLATDGRGKHSNRPHAIQSEVKDGIREHIRSFPKRTSHYSRSDNSKRAYLAENLSISRMYRLYLDKHEPQIKESGAKPQVKEWLYRKIFNEEFNLSFGYPRSDTCETCDEMHIAIKAAKTDQEREPLQSDLAAHQEKASQGYQSLRNDTEYAKGSDDCIVLTFDLMQNLPVPTLTHSSMFYQRQMWEYNFGIHDCTSGTATMCMWSESTAARGADEICSALSQYVSHLPSGISRLICFSDSCYGQNKNFLIICFWNWLILQGRFKQIDHKYLVRGHTYLPNDRDFSHIEKRKSTAKIFLPSHWETVVREACVTKPFIVNAMDSSAFLDFSLLLSQFTHRKKDANKKPVLISKAVWFNLGEAIEPGETNATPVIHTNQVWIRYTYSSEEPWSKVSLLKGRQKKQPSKSLCFPSKYPHGRPLKPSKIDDLQKMVPFLPVEYRQFYIDLASQPGSTNDSDSDSD